MILPGFTCKQTLKFLASKTSPLFQLGTLNHVAIAVPSVDTTALFYKNVLSAYVSEKVPLPEHGVYTVFVYLGNTKIELLEPLGENSPIRNFFKKNPNGGIHHICIEVNRLKECVDKLKTHGIRALDPEPKIGAHGKPVVFLHPKDLNGVLLELEEHN